MQKQLKHYFSRNTNKKNCSKKKPTLRSIDPIQDIQGPSTSKSKTKTTKDSTSKRKKIKKPRVEIEYEVETVPPTRQRIHQ